MKLFELWNKIKISVEDKDRPRYDMADIWMMSLGENIGVEEGGKGNNFLRPVIVIRKYNSDFFFGIPLSNTDKDGEFYFKFEFKGKMSNALISQMRVFDAKRLLYRMGSINKDILESLKQKTRSIIS